MTHKTPPRRRTLYILHILEADGTIWHYVGDTFADRLSKRLAEHRRPTGCCTPSAATARNAEITLATTIPNITKGIDAPFNASRASGLLCPICNPPKPPKHAPNTADEIAQRQRGGGSGKGPVDGPSALALRFATRREYGGHLRFPPYPLQHGRPINRPLPTHPRQARARARAQETWRTRTEPNTPRKDRQKTQATHTKKTANTPRKA